MQPSESFWDGVGRGIGGSPWWAMLGALLIVATVFLVAKYIYPGYKELRMKREENEREIKMRELDIREREAENDSERIRSNAALAENMRGLRESNDTLSTTNAAMLARLNESASHSRDMGDAVSNTYELEKSTNSMVSDIHRHMFMEGTD